MKILWGARLTALCIARKGLNMDNISINKLKIFASSGRFYYVSAQLFQDNKKVAAEDDIEDSTNYKMVCDTIISEFAKSDFNLLETITDRISKEILLRFPLVKKNIIEVEYNNSTRDILPDSFSRRYF